MFYYLIYNSTFIKKDTFKNKNVTTLIYGTIVYILVHGLIYVNKSIKDTLLRYFWVLFSVDIISIFLSTEITSELQNHNFIKDNETKDDEQLKKKKKKKRVEEKPDKLEKKELRHRKPSKQEISEQLKKVEELDPRPVSSKDTKIMSNSIEELQRSRMEMDFKQKNINLEETQNILDEIDQENKEKKVQFDVPDDTKSELSDGSDLEIDLESFEKSLLED